MTLFSSTLSDISERKLSLANTVEGGTISKTKRNPRINDTKKKKINDVVLNDTQFKHFTIVLNYLEFHEFSQQFSEQVLFIANKS